MDTKHAMSAMTRNEKDAAKAIEFILFAMLVLLCTAVLSVHLLSSLPPEIGYGIIFSVGVFAAVCIGAFMKSEIQSSHQGPPQLEFRNPARSRRRRTKRRAVAKTRASRALS